MPKLTNYRDRCIVCDVAFGATYEEMAKKHGVHINRIGQIIEAKLKHYGFRNVIHLRQDPEEIVWRLRGDTPKHWIFKAQTPEEFFIELSNEARLFR